MYAPADIVAQHIRSVSHDDRWAHYTPLEGIPELRRAFAQELSLDYGTSISPDDLLITAGANQAFTTTISALASVKDEVILGTPYYFNHYMWLQLDQLVSRFLPISSNGRIELGELVDLVNPRTKAIVLVSPGNPTGVTLSPDLLESIADIAQSAGVALVLDETYRAFRDSSCPPHHLLQRSNWRNHVVSIHSFSKEFALPGHRVGAAIAGPSLLAEMAKILDCVAICAPRLGQEAALCALTKAQDWREQRVNEVIAKQRHFTRLMAERPGGFILISCGGFYGWVQHPQGPGTTPAVVEALVVDHGIVPVSGTAFMPEDLGLLRFSFASLTFDEIDELCVRLAQYSTTHECVDPLANTSAPVEIPNINT